MSPQLSDNLSQLLSYLFTQNASKQARGCAFSDVVVQIYEALSQGIYSFALGKLCTDYEKYIKSYFIPDATVNKTWFKGELPYFYKQYGIQENTDGRHGLLIIPKGMKSIVQNVCFPSLYTLEATQMAGIAKPLHCDMNNFILEANVLNECRKDSIPPV